MRNIVQARNYNLESCWETCSLDTGYDENTYTASITIPANSFVQHCFVQQVMTPKSNGGAVVIVGDSNDTDGFIKATYPDAKDNEIIGNDLDDLGVYVVQDHKDASDEVVMERSILDDRVTLGMANHIGKFYSTETDVTLSVTTTGDTVTRPGKYRMWLKVLHLVTKED